MRRKNSASHWFIGCAVALGCGSLLAVQVANAERLRIGHTEPAQSVSSMPAPTGRGSSAKSVDRVKVGTTSPPVSAGEALSATAVAGATFYAINPFRAYDSRPDPNGLWLAGDSGVIDVFTDLNNAPKIPSNAVAVTYNLTATGTFGGGGYLSLWAAGQPWPGTSSINWFASGLDLANGGVVGTFPITQGNGFVNILCGSVPNTATDVIIDITGYYAP